MKCRDCEKRRKIHKHGRCIKCHRERGNEATRGWRRANRERSRQLDRERKRRGRADGTDYAERQRAAKRAPDAKVARNARRRTPEQREKARLYQQRYRLREDVQARARARVAVQHALKRGDLVRPDSCERCGKKPGKAADGRSLIRADHFQGYDKDNYLNVQWICATCDGALERERKNGRGANRRA